MKMERRNIYSNNDGVYSTDYGWGGKDDDANGGVKGSRYCRTYVWNEHN